MKAGSIEKQNKVVIIGASAGGVLALKNVLSSLPDEISYTIVVVIHRLKNVDSKLELVLQTFTKITVKEVDDKELLEPGKIYLAPRNYHLLMEYDGRFALSVSETVNFSRPSIDVSFISFSEIFGDRLIGVLLTGANADGAFGLQSIDKNQGKTIVQDTREAQVAFMPAAGLKMVPHAEVMTLRKIGKFLGDL